MYNENNNTNINPNVDPNQNINNDLNSNKVQAVPTLEYQREMVNEVMTNPVFGENGEIIDKFEPSTFEQIQNEYKNNTENMNIKSNFNSSGSIDPEDSFSTFQAVYAMMGKFIVMFVPLLILFAFVFQLLSEYISLGTSISNFVYIAINVGFNLLVGLLVILSWRRAIYGISKHKKIVQNTVNSIFTSMLVINIIALCIMSYNYFSKFDERIDNKIDTLFKIKYGIDSRYLNEESKKEYEEEKQEFIVIYKKEQKWNIIIDVTSLVIFTLLGTIYSKKFLDNKAV